MQPRALDLPAPMLGREEQLKALESFVQPDAPKRALVLLGEAGIGKTTLWKAGISLARASGLKVLSARAGDTETFSFASLSDLFDGVDLDLLGDLAAPQRLALEVALRRVAPAGSAFEPFAIQVGLLSAIRILAEGEPLVVAVDDVASADAPSANALAYAIRRLEGGPVRFMFARRAGRPSEVERAFGPEDVQTVEVGPLSFGAISHLISKRLARSFPRRVLRRVFETSDGNPLFALELARTLVAKGLPEIGADLPLPDMLEEVFGARVAELAGPVRHVVLAVALSPGLTRPALDTLADRAAVEDALGTGLLIAERSRLRASHPLLGAAARRQSNARERRELHRDLAAVVTDPTLRARHRALAAVSSDNALAGSLATAATDASERGAVHDAVELAAHALRLTPRDAVEHSDRVLALAEYLQVAGYLTRATQLLAAHMDEFPPGRARATAHMMLGEAADFEAHGAHLDRALAETAHEPRLRALVLVRKALLQGINRVERIPQAEAMAEDALAGVDSADADLLRRVLAVLAWMRILRGRQIDDLVRRFPKRTMRLRLYDTSIVRPIGVRLAFRGRVGESRAYLEQHLALAEEFGEAQSEATLYLHVCEVVLRAGNVAEAVRLIDEWDHWTALGDMELRSTQRRLRALLFALRGEPAKALRLAADLLAAAPSDIAGSVWDELEANRAGGIASLLRHDAAGAVRHLLSVWEHTVREGIEDPGAFPVAGDLVEALVETGDLETARAVTERLARLSSRQHHPWGQATAKRAAALLRLVNAYDDEAAAALAGAAADYGRLKLEFDRARTLLFLGRVQRRFKKRSEARRSLEDAIQAFDDAGCSGWADEARSELARVSGKRSADEGELTASEQRVATLAAKGLSNKEIAGRLFVTVYTVEAHLSHAYAKLGVRSRAELAHRLAHTP